MEGIKYPSDPIWIPIPSWCPVKVKVGTQRSRRLSKDPKVHRWTTHLGRRVSTARRPKRENPVWTRMITDHLTKTPKKMKVLSLFSPDYPQTNGSCTWLFPNKNGSLVFFFCFQRLFVFLTQFTWFYPNKWKLSFFFCFLQKFCLLNGFFCKKKQVGFL